MTMDELARACVYALLRPREIFGNSLPVVGIAGSRKAPLAKRSFPKWKYLAFSPNKKPVYHYPAEELLRALAFHGLIDITKYTDGGRWLLPPIEGTYEDSTELDSGNRPDGSSPSTEPSPSAATAGS